jgi:hypothetical protein
MDRSRPALPARLEGLPNIGPAIARDLRAIGIARPDQLVGRDPLGTYLELGPAMGRRHDPCVLYTLISVRRFLDGEPAQPWWTFTGEGRALLAGIR